MYKYDWKFFIARIVFCIVVVAVIVGLVSSCPEPCKHEERREEYSFESQNATSPNYIGYKKKFCKNCDYYFGNTYFYETPSDLSYLDLIREHSDGDELIDGEYYTMSATVNLNYVYGITCRVENDDIRVYFSVDFREEFKEAVKLMETGDEITFRGKFDITSCDWTDCELGVIL